MKKVWIIGGILLAAGTIAFIYWHQANQKLRGISDKDKVSLRNIKFVRSN